MAKKEIIAVQDYVIDFDSISCPNWIDFNEENYEEGEADVRWFASLQPHLRTPQFIIKAEAQSARNTTAVDIANTPTVKERKRPKTMENSKPPKLLANKLEFSSSDDDEITEMLRAHNKRIQHLKFIKPSVSNVLNREKSQDKKSILEPTNPSVGVAGIASKPAKRRSCAPLLLKNKNAKCFSSFVKSDVITHLIKENDSSDSQTRVINSTIPPKAVKTMHPKSVISSDSCKANSSKTVNPSKFSKSPTEASSKPSITSKAVRQGSITKRHVPSIKSTTNKPVSLKNSAPKLKSLPVTKPVIKSNGPSRPVRPQTSISLSNKVESASTKNKTKVISASSVSTKRVNPSRDVSKPPYNSSKNKPLSQVQSKAEGPFKASSSVLSIINSKTPGKAPVKSRPSEFKPPRYSVETPSPPRSGVISDDDDLDAFIMAQLKAHNAKVEAKMIANNRIPGKASKTGKQVSLHLGSPSRPKMKPVRHKN